MIVYKQCKYRVVNVRKDGLVRWRCTIKACTATLLTDSSKTEVIKTSGEHTESCGLANIQWDILRESCKRQALQCRSESPGVIIDRVLNDYGIKNLKEVDLRCIKKAMYTVRKKTSRGNPNTKKRSKGMAEK
jgi:hypothetical protein